MVGQFIDTFWRKSFIGELRLARKVAEDETLWTLTHAGKAHQFQFVWLQGLCVKVGALIRIQHADAYAVCFAHR